MFHTKPKARPFKQSNSIWYIKELIHVHVHVHVHVDHMENTYGCYLAEIGMNASMFESYNHLPGQILQKH